MMIAQNHNEQGQWKPLQRWGVIVVEGDDAGTFLQGQLTHHIQDLASNAMQMAGFCTAKGRLLGNFWVFCPPSPTQTIFWLLCRADLIPALVKRLNMFVLRSKCKVMDGRPHIQVLLEENNANHNVENHFQNNNDEFRFNINWGSQHDGMHHATVVLNSNFMLHLVSSTDISTATIPAEANSADDAFETYWTQRGLGFIQAQTVESFTPQAINLDLVGGVSFNKGCYPGQEVVARTHYLGKIKRRAVLCQVMQTEVNSTLPATWATESAGMDVWASTQNREPIGQIIQMAFDGNTHWALVELPLELLSENIQWTVRAKQSSIEQNNTDSTPQAELCSLLPKPELLPYSLSGKGNPFE